MRRWLFARGVFVHRFPGDDAPSLVFPKFRILIEPRKRRHADN